MPLRLAIISTPRSGNTWLRQLLMDAYAIPGLSTHRLDDLDWAGLPPECALQLHWRRTPALAGRLEHEGFRVLTVARHPLDTLVSILQFCLHDDSTLQWMDGEGGSELPIHGAMPGSAAFQDYAVGPRAAALMAVTPEWRAAADCILVPYEELVADTAGRLGRIAEALGEPVRRPIQEVAEGATIPKLRARTGVPHHFWQGRPGLWTRLLVAPVAERLAQAHRAFCAELGYSCLPDPQLTPAQADANWLGLVWPQATEKLHHYRRARLDLAQAREESGRLQAEYSALEHGYHELRQAYQELKAHCATVESAYRQADAAYRAVRAERQPWLGDLMRRLNGTASAVKRVLHREKPPISTPR